MENESQDQSVRFVQWIKSNDSSSSRRRASVQQTTLRILTTNKSNLSQQFIEEQDETTTSAWQCLQDAHGIELCTVDSQGDYEEMEDLEGEMRQHSDFLCAS